MAIPTTINNIQTILYKMLVGHIRLDYPAANKNQYRYTHQSPFSSQVMVGTVFYMMFNNKHMYKTN